MTVTSIHWADRGNCHPSNYDPKPGWPEDPVDLMFPDREEGVDYTTLYNRAKECCQGCPVRLPCLTAAIEHNPPEDFGVWGGKTPRERRTVRRAWRKNVQAVARLTGTAS